MAVVVEGVQENSPAQKAGFQAGDRIISIDGEEITDFLDYTFYATKEKIKVSYERDGKLKKKTVRKDEYEDLGLEFATYLMDQHRRCANNCIFCFVDQMPPGMRDSLYFKDDDARLSFLFGNYITLTNMSQRDIDRIIKMKISPINVSVHTTDPQLRCSMMGSRFAGRALETLYKFADAGIKLNCQLVLCPGINDGEKLSQTIEKLGSLYPSVQSIACVPVGLTDYREGLTKLRTYTKEEAAETIDRIDRFGDRYEADFGQRIVYASDEFYLLAQRPFPAPSYYGDYMQLDNGVGMSVLFQEEFRSALQYSEDDADGVPFSIATGAAAYNLISGLIDEAREKWHNLQGTVHLIYNDFFGRSITVAGLITGRDLIAQLSGKDLGARLILPRSMIRYQGDCFLDDVTIEEAEKALHTKIVLCENDGGEFLDLLLKGGD